MLILNIITLANLLLLFSILMFRKNNSLPNKILALILINPGINFLSNIIVLSGHFYDFPYFYFFAQVTCFLFAPLVYLYTCLFTGIKTSLKNPLYIITACFLVMVIYFAVDFSMLDKASQTAYLNGILNEPYPMEMTIANGLFILMQQVYFTASIFKVYQYKKRIKQNLSNFAKTKWQYISRFILIIWFLNLITIGLYLVFPMVQVEYIYLPLVLTAIYFFILTYSFNQNSIFTQNDYEDFLTKNKFPITILGDTRKDDDFKIEEELQSYKLHLQDYLEKEEPFTNPDLTLEILAKETNIPINKLSIVINRGLGINFYDLINEKRVEKSKILLMQKGTEITIEYIAYESGFNSRASFYRAFKKHIGLTPKEFLKESTSFA